MRHKRWIVFPPIAGLTLVALLVARLVLPDGPALSQIFAFGVPVLYGTTAFSIAWALDFWASRSQRYMWTRRLVLLLVGDLTGSIRIPLRHGLPYPAMGRDRLSR